MAWKVESKDAITRDGRRAFFMKYEDHSWPCPWVFKIEGQDTLAHYSIGGFKNNHGLEQHDTDLMGPYEEPKIAGRTKQQWTEFARRDDCLDSMVPSDLRQLVSAIK